MPALLVVRSVVERWRGPKGCHSAPGAHRGLAYISATTVAGYLVIPPRQTRRDYWPFHPCGYGCMGGGCSPARHRWKLTVQEVRFGKPALVVRHGAADFLHAVVIRGPPALFAEIHSHAALRLHGLDVAMPGVRVLAWAASAPSQTLARCSTAV